MQDVHHHHYYFGQNPCPCKCAELVADIKAQLTEIKGDIKMAATKADLDAAIASLKTDQAAYSAAALAAIAKAGQGIDVTDDVVALQGIDADIKAGLAALSPADPGTGPTPTV